MRNLPCSLFCALLLALCAGPLLASCGSQPLLSDLTLSAPEIAPTGHGETVTIGYRIGKPTSVTLSLTDAKGTAYALRSGERRTASADPYALRFDGTAATDDPALRRRALPSGSYTVMVVAKGDDGSSAQLSAPLTIRAADAPPPQIDNLVVSPVTISPNEDGIDDVTEITFQLPFTATLDIELSGPGCAPFCPFVTADRAAPTPQRFIWNGRTVDGARLADGAYTLTIRAKDRYGNVVEQRQTVTIAGAGQPEATITYSYIAPQAVMLGDVITVTMRVKNTGDVPIRTYGPPSGYEYSTDDVFSSVDGGAYTSKSGGFWRIGVDWDANSGGAAKRYPYRWALSPRPPSQWKVPNVEDVLLPGEEAVVTGRIRIRQQETKMGFYLGLIQDGVGFFQDRSGRTIVRVGL